jgi:toxin ParE1/3/4
MFEPFRIILMPEAYNDLKSLHKHIERDAPDAAAGMVERILESIELLKVFPHRHAVTPAKAPLGKQVRSLPVPPYVVFFRVLDQDRTVIILTVRHGAHRPPLFD